MKACGLNFNCPGRLYDMSHRSPSRFASESPGATILDAGNCVTRVPRHSLIPTAPVWFPRAGAVFRPMVAYDSESCLTVGAAFDEIIEAGGRG